MPESSAGSSLQFPNALLAVGNLPNTLPGAVLPGVYESELAQQGALTEEQQQAIEDQELLGALTSLTSFSLGEERGGGYAGGPGGGFEGVLYGADDGDPREALPMASGREQHLKPLLLHQAQHQQAHAHHQAAHMQAAPIIDRAP